MHNADNTGDELLKKLREMQEEQDKFHRGGFLPSYPYQPQPCPSCGHCPTCGRRNTYTITYGPTTFY